MIIKTFVPALLLASSTSAFVLPQHKAFGTALAASRVDSTSAIQQALEASRKYGPSSKEARLAWEIVEEGASSDNSPAFQGTLDQDCLVETSNSQECSEYADKLDELSALLKEHQPRLERLKYLAEEIKAIQLPDIPSEPAVSSPQLKAALAAAQAAVKEFGVDSSQAKLAYADVEEIASSGLSNAMGARLDEECLVDTAMDACMALEELNRVLNLEHSRKNQGLNG